MTSARTYRDTCNLFDELTERLHNEMYTITNPNRLITEATSIASEQLQQKEIEEYETLTEVILDENSLDLPSEVIESLTKDLEEKTYQQRIPETTIRGLNKAEQFNASATLIYAHAHFEICLDNILSISTYSHKNRWHQEISNQTIKVEDLLSSNLEELLIEKVEGKLQKISREGVKFKLELLFRLFRPTSDQKQPKDYIYSLDHVIEIDDLRHKVVHESPFIYNRDRLKDDIKYLNMTVLYLIMILFFDFKMRKIPKEYNHLHDTEGNKIKG